VKFVWVLLATALAVALQTTLNRWVRVGTVDLVLIVVVYHALVSGRVTGMLAGTFAGLVQDVLSGSVIGMAGLSKTVVGFLAGIVGTQFIVAHSASRFVVFFLATALDQAIFMGLNELLQLRHFGVPYATVGLQGLANAMVGVLTFKLVELLPGAMERRRMARTGLRR
jgi:rod shape-determining protein MreD